MSELSDRLSGIQRNNQANFATARARAVQRGIGTPNTAPRPQSAPRSSGLRPSISSPARSIAELGQMSQQITNRIHAARRQSASPHSFTPAAPTLIRSSYYQKYGQPDYSEQLLNVEHAIEDTLEQLDVVAHRLNARLQRRPSIDDLQQRGVLPSTAGAPQLAASALALERWPAGAKSRPRLHPPPLIASRDNNAPAHPCAPLPAGQRVADSLNSSLARRPSLSEVQQAGIIKGQRGMAPRNIDAAEQLQKSLRRNSLDQQLASRPSYDELVEAGIAKGQGVGPRVAEGAERLRKQLLRDSISYSLSTRPPAEALHEAGIIKALPGSGVSARVVAGQEQLQRRLLSDDLEHSLARRRSVDELRNAGIIKDNVSGKLAAQADQLKKQQLSDQLKQGLNRRASLDLLLEMGYYRDQ